MQKTLQLLFILIASFMVVTTLSAKEQKILRLNSPNEKITAEIFVGDIIEYSVKHNHDLMLERSSISVTLTDGTTYGIKSKLINSTTKAINQTIEASLYKRKVIIDNYNEITLKFKEGFNIIFRAYDDGVAYRFISNSKKAFEVKEEQVVFNFPTDSKIYVPYVQHQRNSLEEQFYNSFENTYQYINLTQWDKKRLAFSPLVLEGVNGKKVAIVESDLIDYPGMYLYNAKGDKSLAGVFAPYPKEIKQGGHNMLQGEVQSREKYLAQYDKGRSFPWRALVISEHDYELADNDMVYKLATPADTKIDYSWVKPGKVAWDWWNDWNLYNVDFKTGVNPETYKYYIDFASKYGIEYVILDEGWSVNLQADLFQVVPDINLEELVKYAQDRNVDLILWAGYLAFNKDIEGICKHYSEMGIKGFKVDFMDRDDQLMVDFHYRAAQIASKYKMLLDFHGSYKPTGLQRTFPNVINFEGVHGLEQMKWSEESVDQVTYDVTIPFTRMLAGPMDYTQGAMRNSSHGNYRPVNSEAMSQGTRCRQLAEYVIFESPLNMMCDSPSNYMQEPECTEFIAEIPTVWDNTIALNGEIGKYITIARQKNNVWYVGAMTNWDERDVTIDLSLLGEGDFEAEIFKDGVNANRIARDYKKEVITIPQNKKITLSMAKGGGAVLVVKKL